MTLLSLSIYVIFVDSHQGNNDVMPFSLSTTKAYVEFIGREKDRAYLQCIYCKVRQRIQRELSHTIKSRCACLWIYEVDICGG
jgi:lauroyl/myristoyl acyltransferase